MNEKIQFKVFAEHHWTPSKINGDYREIETITAKDDGGQDIIMTRFVKPSGRGVDSYRVKVGQVYCGALEPKKPEYDTQTVKNVKALTDFGGDIETDIDAWDTTDPEQEALKRQAHFDAFGDIHTGIHIATAFLVEQMRLGNPMSESDIIELIIEKSLLCRDARLDLENQYYKELKAENGKESK